MAQKRDPWQDVIDFDNSSEAQGSPPRYTPAPDGYSNVIDFAPQEGARAASKAQAVPGTPTIGASRNADVLAAPEVVSFGDEGGANARAGRPNLRLTPDQETQLVHILSTAPIDQAAEMARAYLRPLGFAGGNDNFDNVIEARRATGKVNGQFAYAKPQPVEPSSTTNAALEGTGEGSTLGAAPKILAMMSATNKALGLGSGGDDKYDNTDHGGFWNNYNASLDQYEAQRGQDAGDHPIAYFGGQLAGGALLPSGAAATADRSALEAGRAALRSGASMEDARTIAQIAGRRAFGNRAAIEGAGYGGTYGALSSDNPADAVRNALAGAALGGLAGKGFGELGRAAPVARRVGGLISSIDATGQRLQDSMTKGGAYETAANLLGNSISGSPNDVLASIANRPTAIWGTAPTLAEVAADPGIAGFQRGFGNTNMGGAADLSGRNVANALARMEEATGALRSESPQSLQDFASRALADAEKSTGAQQSTRQAAIDARIANQRTGAANALSSAQDALTGSQTAIGATADRTATGAAARKAYGEAYDVAKAKTRGAYAAPVLNQPQPIEIPRDVFMKVRNAADDFYGDGGGEIPSRLQSIIGDMADQNATTRTLTNIDRRLADFAGEARMQGRAAEGAFAERVRSTLGDFTNAAAPQAYRDALKVAKAARAEQGRLFETGDVAATFATDRYGVPSVGDTTVPGRLARPGAAGGDTIDRLINAVGPAKAENTVREELRREIEEGAVNSGAQMTRLATRYGEAIKRFPGLSSDIAELQRNAAALDVAKTANAEALAAAPTLADKVALGERTALHNSILASPLAKLADASVDPSSFVANLLRRSDNGRQLQTLYRMVKDSEPALNGLRTSLGDFIETAGRGNNFSAAGEQIPSITGMRGAIATVVKRGGDILTYRQKLVLQQIGRELENASFAATAAKPAGSETAINRTFDDVINNNPLVPSKAKSVLNVLYGALGNREQVKALVNKAILDPDFAATLLKRPTAQHWRTVQKILPLRSSNRSAPVSLAPDIFGLQKALSDAFTGSVPLRAAANNNGNESGVVDRQDTNDQAPK